MTWRVRPVSFDGSTQAPAGVHGHEEYWTLIGSEEDLIESRDERALVVFDRSIAALSLECHDPIPNSLWSRHVDVAFVDPNQGTAFK